MRRGGARERSNVPCQLLVQSSTLDREGVHRYYWGMSAKEVDKDSVAQADLQWVACMGDFLLLKRLLSKKRHSFPWVLFACLDALLRGFGQVVFANNPISGIMITIAFASSVPGSLVASAVTGFLGLLLSLLLQDSGDNIGNGLTIYNPLLIGSVTHGLLPNFYGRIDTLAVLVTAVGAIFSVYLTRSLGTGRFPCITVPFNVVEIIVLLVLTMQRDFGDELVVQTYGEPEKNASARLLEIDGLINDTHSAEKLNWGLVFRGVVTSASQVYAIDDVATASVIYLAIIVYSPLTALFSFLGALTGTLVALGLGVPQVPVYSGLWGYNALLTGGAFGGLFLVMSGQTAAAAFVAMIFTSLFQYVIEPLLAKIGLPVLTIPFVVSAWLFFGLRDSVDATFPRPTFVTFPEHELHYFRVRTRECVLSKVEEGSDPEIATSDEKKSSND